MGVKRGCCALVAAERGDGGDKPISDADEPAPMAEGEAAALQLRPCLLQRLKPPCPGRPCGV